MPKNISRVISLMFEKNILAFPSRILVNARIAKIKDSSQSATKLEYHACLVSTHNIETLKYYKVLPKAFQIHWHDDDYRVTYLNFSLYKLYFSLN